MSDTTIPVNIDPRAARQGLEEIAKSARELSANIEEALGKKAPESMEKMEDAAEKGSNRISTFFRNLGKRVKEDLKTAFDLGAVTQGLNMAKNFNEGIKEVFNLEKAFDRLNTRLGLTSSGLLDLKRNLGRAVAGTGQKVEDILPGVETASAKGNIKDPKQLAQIAQYLGQAKAITGEGVEGISEDVVDILKSQHKQITAQSFKETLDAIEGTRTAGAFKNATDAAGAIKDMAPFAQKLGLNTRDLGGLAAVASKSGDAGTNILKQIMEKGTSIGGQQVLNAALGQSVFQNGKLNVEALKKVNTERFGQYSQQVLEQTTGLSGANGADLKRFIDSFKEGTEGLAKVTSGADETSKQFQTATDNLASEFDQFRQGIVQSASELGDALSTAGHALIHGDMQGVTTGLKDAGKTAWENKGSLLAAGALSVGSAVLAGGGLRSLLGKVGGGLVAGEAAKAAGVTPVYVVNAAEIGGGGGVIGKIGQVAGGGGALAALGTAGLWTGGVALAGAGGYAAGMGINKLLGNDGQLGAKLYDLLHPQESNNQADQHDSLKKAIVDGVVEGHAKAKGSQKTTFTNPSDMSGNRGRSM